MFFERIGTVCSSLLWGWPVLITILLAGANLSVRTGFFQLTHFILWSKKTIFSLFSRKLRKDSPEGISPLQSISTALAGSIGTGNIVGVATALTIGGAGSIFWMWVSAFLGMMTLFAENVLGIKYRKKGADGAWQGGAMYYIEHGLRCKPLAKLFAGACVLASLGMGNMVQANSISSAFTDSFRLSPLLSGGILSLLLFFISCGGMRRIVRVTEKLVPLMAIGYFLACLVILIFCHDRLLSSFTLIFREAFSLRAVAGGSGGVIMLKAMQTGVSRGIFTNEAGLGSSVIAHAGSCATSPVEQGMWGIFQVFIDTIVICTLTALCILSTGTLATGKTGAALSAAAFRHIFGSFGTTFVAVSIALFAFATMLAWCCYGEKCLTYLNGKKLIWPYRILFALCTFTACQVQLDVVWRLSDNLNGLMAIPNLAAVFLLSGEVTAELRLYLHKKRKLSVFRSS